MRHFRTDRSGIGCNHFGEHSDTASTALQIANSHLGREPPNEYQRSGVRVAGEASHATLERQADQAAANQISTCFPPDRPLRSSDLLANVPSKCGQIRDVIDYQVKVLTTLYRVYPSDVIEIAKPVRVNLIPAFANEVHLGMVA